MHLICIINGCTAQRHKNQSPVASIPVLSVSVILCRCNHAECATESLLNALFPPSPSWGSNLDILAIVCQYNVCLICSKQHGKKIISSEFGIRHWMWSMMICLNFGITHISTSLLSHLQNKYRVWGRIVTRNADPIWKATDWSRYDFWQQRCQRLCWNYSVLQSTIPFEIKIKVGERERERTEEINFLGLIQFHLLRGLFYSQALLYLRGVIKDIVDFK